MLNTTSLRLAAGQSKRGCGLCIKKISHISATPVQLYSSTISSNYNDYLQKSIVPTHHFQKSLPRLPIPKLEKTCERYLRSQEPVLSPDEYCTTRDIVNRFRDGEGQALHDELVAMDKRNKHTSYISGPWFDMYLSDRRPLVLNHNPFVAFNNDPKAEYNNQLIRATNMVVSSLRYLKTYRANLLEPEVYHLNPAKSDNQTFRNVARLLPSSLSWYGAYLYKAFPLDMSQYDRLFNSTRIPRPGKDQLVSDPSAKHILVLRNGHIYTVDVLDQDGNIFSPDVIMSHLKYILEDPRPAPKHPLGVMTTQDRDTWATVRQRLVDTGNEIPLKQIDSSLFVLIFEDVAPQDPNTVTRLFLHGNGANRWYDKSFSLILNKDGRACVNFEHAWGDGVAVLRYFNEIFKDTTENPYVHPQSVPAKVDSANTVREIEFHIDPSVKESIAEAQRNFDETTSNLDLDHLEYMDYTKTYIKTQKISPDAVIQLAIQMAYYKHCGSTAATYESCSTAAFKHGRTETVRSCTAATKKACDMLLSPSSTATPAEMKEALMTCSSVHSALTKDAAMGQGFDRHLFAMKAIVQSKGEPLPEIYQDPSYAKLNHVILSTSTLSSPAVEIGGFAPVVPDGYGIGYAIEDNRIGFNITSYKGHQNAKEFVECAKSSLDDIREVFEGRKPSVKS